MYISRTRLKMMLETMQECKAPTQFRLEYNDWRKLMDIATKNDCPRCYGDKFADNDNDVCFDRRDGETVIFKCHDCNGTVTIRENRMFHDIVAQRHKSDVTKVINDTKSRLGMEKQRQDRLKASFLDTGDYATESVLGIKPIQDAPTLDASYIMSGDITSAKVKNNLIEEGDYNMMNTNKMFKGLDFGKANKNEYRLSHLGLAIKNAEGTFVSYDTANEELIDVDLFDFDLDGMIYKMPVAHNQVAAGDVIVHNGKSVIVESVLTNGRIKVIDPVQGEAKDIMPTKNMFGFNFFTKILCLMDMNNLGASNDNPFGNMMPMLMMSAMKDGNGGNDMMTMMMMSQMMGGNTQMGDMFSNPMMMMAMMSGDGKMGDMLPMMMMSGMFNQNQTPKAAAKPNQDSNANTDEF